MLASPCAPLVEPWVRVLDLPLPYAFVFVRFFSALSLGSRTVAPPDDSVDVLVRTSAPTPTLAPTPTFCADADPTASSSAAAESPASLRCSRFIIVLHALDWRGPGWKRASPM